VLPTVIVIGAMKAATTSLHYYLGLHPEISMSREKELSFFVEELNWDRGLAWYESRFSGETTHHGESSPAYTAYPQYLGVPARMRAVVPEARLVYVVRDPVERLVSHYVHMVASGMESRPLEEAVKDPPGNQYLARSWYAMQLAQFLAHYPRSQILVVGAEELRDRRDATLGEIFRFLEVDDSFRSPRFRFVRHRSSMKRRTTSTGRRLSRLVHVDRIERLPSVVQDNAEWLLRYPFSRRVARPVVPATLRQDLVEAFRDDARELRELTGRPFEGWCV
jgi:hypothetical protein